MRRTPGEAPGRIVVRAPNWLGDLMMSTGALRAILARWPEAAVDVIVRTGHETLPLPHRGRMLPYDDRKISPGAFGAALRLGGYDRFYVLPPSFSAAWMARRSRVAVRIGYRGQLRGALLRPALAHRAPPRSVHLAREYLDLVDPELPLERFPPRLAVTDDWIGAQLSRTCRDLPGRFVAVAPGAVYGPAKAWPAGHFRDLARGLRERTGLPVVLVGTREERELGERVRDGRGGILNWCGETDLAALAAVLARAALVISNDSGAMHLAAALGRPQVAIFGSTSPAWTGPLDPAAAVVSLGLECAPCFRRTCRRGHYACLTRIAPATVLDRAAALLESAATAALPMA